MKTKLSRALSTLILLFIAAGISSCTKDPIGDNSQPAYVAAINASSTAQDFYIDNAKVNTTALAYSQYTGYQSITAAITHQLSFNTTGTTTINAATGLNGVTSSYYTVFYSNDKSTVIVQDYRPTQQSTQARVRFINLATANIAFDIGLTNSTTRITTGLPYKTYTGFTYVDAGSTFSLYQAGGSTVLLNMPAVLKANNTYTIYIAGSTQATLDFQTITQN